MRRRKKNAMMRMLCGASSDHEMMPGTHAVLRPHTWEGECRCRRRVAVVTICGMDARNSGCRPNEGLEPPLARRDGPVRVRVQRREAPPQSGEQSTNGGSRNTLSSTGTRRVCELANGPQTPPKRRRMSNRRQNAHRRKQNKSKRKFRMRRGEKERRTEGRMKKKNSQKG